MHCRRLLGSLSLGIALLLGQARAESLSPADQRMLDSFDRELPSLERNRTKLHKMPKSMVQRSLAGLTKHLDGVSPAGRAAGPWKERKAKLDELTQLAAGGAPAAKGPSSEDRSLLGRFDRDLTPLESEARRSPDPARYTDKIETLRAVLLQVSQPGRASGEYQAATKRLEELEARLAQRKALEAEAASQREAALAAAQAQAQAMREAEAARAKVGPSDFTYPDLQRLEDFDGACRRWNANPGPLRKMGQEGCEAILADLTRRLDAMRPELQQHPKILERRKRIEGYRAAMDEIVLRRIPEPAPSSEDQPLTASTEAAVRAFDQAMAERGEGVRQPGTLRSHLAALRLLDELRAALSRVATTLGGRGCLEYRQRQYQWKLLEKRIEDAYGGPLEDLSSGDEALLKDLRHHLYMARRDQRKGPLELQDPRARAELEQTLTDLKAALARASSRRTREYLELVEGLTGWEASQRELLAASEDLKRQAPDLDGQLKLVQDLFPKDRFDPKPPTSEDPAMIRAWAARLANWKQAVPGFLAFFEKAKATSLEARRPEFAQYAQWFERAVPGRIDQAARSYGGGYRSRFETGTRAVDEVGRAAEGPASQADRLREALQAGIDAGLRLQAFAEGFRGKPEVALAEGMARMEKAKEQLAGGFEAARKARRLPPALHQDPDLLEVARKVLGANRTLKGLRLRGAPKAQRGWVVRGDWMYLEAWESFSVVYALKEGSRWVIEYADLARDLTGKTRGDWHLSAVPSNLGHEVLEENIEE